MSFSTQGNLGVIPWMTFEEWDTVFTQVYSNNLDERRKSYETMLVWKARTPVLTAGIDCTLELLEVSLRDHDWSAKIEKGEAPFYYENDLRRMYSTAIMRVINHITNLSSSRNTSLKTHLLKMKIPGWIVDLRNDAAHSHEVPPIFSLRNAAQYLFSWLDSEYWQSEQKFLSTKQPEGLQMKSDAQGMFIINAIDLWIATGLYAEAGHKLVEDIQNKDLRNSLFDLFNISNEETKDEEEKDTTKPQKRPNNKEAESLREKLKSKSLNEIQSMILQRISTRLLKPATCKQYQRLICDTIVDRDAFLPDSNFLQIFTNESTSEKLPENLISFWRPFISHLQNWKLIQPLFFRLLEIVKNENGNRTKRLIASLWIKEFLRAALQQKLARRYALLLDQVLDFKNKKVLKTSYDNKVKKQIAYHNPELEGCFHFTFQTEILTCLRDEEFLKELIVEINEYGANYILFVLKLSQDITEQQRDEILQILNIFCGTSCEEKENGIGDRIYSAENFQEDNLDLQLNEEQILFDMTERNSTWELASDNVEWKDYPLGMLPCHQGVKRSTNAISVPAVVITSTESSTFSPGFLDSSQKVTESQINWNKVIRRRSQKRKSGSMDKSGDKTNKHKKTD